MACTKNRLENSYSYSSRIEITCNYMFHGSVTSRFLRDHNWEPHHLAVNDSMNHKWCLTKRKHQVILCHVVVPTTRWAPTSYKWDYNSTYRGDNPSYPFQGPFIGAPKPYLWLVGAHLVYYELQIPIVYQQILGPKSGSPHLQWPLIRRRNQFWMSRTRWRIQVHPPENLTAGTQELDGL